MLPDGGPECIAVKDEQERASCLKTLPDGGRKCIAVKDEQETYALGFFCTTLCKKDEAIQFFCPNTCASCPEMMPGGKP